MRSLGWMLLVGLAACDGGKDPADDTDLPADSDAVDDTDRPPDETDETDPATDDTDTRPDDTDATDDTDVADDTDVSGDDTDAGDTDDTDALVDTDDSDVLVDTDDSDVPVDTFTVLDVTIADIVSGTLRVGAHVALEDVSYIAPRAPGSAIVGEAPGGPGHFIEVLVAPGFGSRLEKELVVEGRVIQVPGPGGPKWAIDASAAPSFVQELQTWLVVPRTPADVASLQDPAARPELADVLVQVAPARVYDVLPGFDWTIGDDQQDVFVSGAQAWPGQMAYGDLFDEVIGVVTWRNGRYELVPRWPADFGAQATGQTAADQLAVGDVVLSEIMVQGTTGPGGVSCTAPATLGDYVEVVNTTGATIDLDGLYVYNLVVNDSFQLRRRFELAPGAREVIWTSTTPCYGLPVELALSQSLRFAFAAPWVGLFNSSTDLDLLWLNGFSTTPGVALELSESLLDPVDNDLPGSWCEASADIVAGSTDRGTPGAPNDCP